MTKKTSPSTLIRMATLGSAISIALMGCQPSTPSDDTAPADTKAHHAHDEGHDHSGHDHSGHDHSQRTKFNCEPEIELGAFYHNENTPKTAHLLLNGIEYDFTEHVQENVTQQTYVSEIGFDEMHGLMWQVEGDNGTLSKLPADNAAAPNVSLEKTKVIHTCKKAS